MELKLNEPRNTFTEGLGLSQERYDQLIKSAKDLVKSLVKANDKKADILTFAQYCASISQDIQEYTLLIVNAASIKEEAYKELYEETCPDCKARKERREKSEKEGVFSFGFGSGGPSVRQTDSGMIIISL